MTRWPDRIGTLGKLAWPYPVERCASDTCRRHFANQRPFAEAGGAYLFRDLDSGKFVVFCDDCAAHVELNHRDRFLLVAI